MRKLYLFEDYTLSSLTQFELFTAFDAFKIPLINYSEAETTVSSGGPTTLPPGTTTVSFTPISNPGPGVTTIDLGGEAIVSSGDHVEFENQTSDIATLNIAAGTYLTNTDTSDEDVVIFYDNSEDDLTINIEDGAILRGVNGVIFIEGDETTINNSGIIEGTGAAEEGVIYYDRDTDGVPNEINNMATGQIRSGNGGPAIAVEVLLADGSDDLEDVGVQDNASDFPTIVINNAAGGLIEAFNTVSSPGDDNDAINIAGNPGTTGGLNREILEIGATDPAETILNGIVNLTIDNSGLIQTDSDSSSSAAINIEDDAIFYGTITNNASGVIVGQARGIRITDIVVEARDTNDDAILDGMGAPIILYADHAGTIINDGIIAGASDGTSTRGIDLEGDGITIINNATGVISGTSRGIEVGDNAHSGENNIIINYGLISSSGTGAVDATSADGTLTFTAMGGSILDGDFLGSMSGTDSFTVDGAGVFELTDDILQDVDVAVTAAGSLSFDSNRTIDGDLTSDGVIYLDLSDMHLLNADLDLVTGSTVVLTDTGGLAASAVAGDIFTLIDVVGAALEDATLDASAITAPSGTAFDLSISGTGDLIATLISTSSSIDGTSGADVLDGTSGDDVINGFEDDDTLNGLDGNDLLNGGLGGDAMDGGAGIDTATYADATGRVIADLQNQSAGYIFGEAIGDSYVSVENLIGSDFNDQLRGDSGSNVLTSGRFSDRLYGRAGDDFLYAEIGGDALYGGTGVDVMTGGDDNQRDRFIYFNTNESGVGSGNRDIITDFTSGEDRIEISRFDANSVGGGGNDVFDFIADAAFSNTAGELRYEKSGGITVVQADMDGDGISDFEIELTGEMDLIAADFLL